MLRSAGTDTYFQRLISYNRFSWVGSVIVAVGINLVFFLAMPHLMNEAPSQPTIEKIVPQVQITRFDEPEPEKKPKERPEPEKPKPEPKPKKKELARKPVKQKLSLPFELNPRLPSGPKTMDLPPMDTAPQIQAPELPDAFSQGDLDGPLSVKVRTPPVYPYYAKRRNIEGWVKVAFVVNTQGRVEEVTILDAKPEGVFEKSVKRCVRKWKFNPGRVGGEPVKTKAQTTIRFKLE